MKAAILAFWALNLGMFLTGFTQNHANRWYFGYNAGINFSTGNAIAVSGGQQYSFEGCSSYSDHNGNLLFYSDGLTIWNKNHLPMTNGTGLMGGLSSTTSALVVRHPGNCHQYFLFTVGDHMSTTNSLRYSIIDMSLSSGLGAVVVGSKNILISNGCAEKITAIRQQNGVDFWIVTHRLSSSAFASYSLTSAGLAPVPVLSFVGSFTASNCMIGFMKPNHAGTKLVSVQTFCNKAEIFDFNRNTGTLTNPQTILSNLPGAYGIEFSPDDNILYLSKGYAGCALYQINPNNVLSTNLITSIAGDYVIGGLQLGPDGKIYVARTNSGFLSVINNPNIWGVGCGYVANGFSLSPGTSSGFGIISFPPEQTISYFPNGYTIHVSDTCYADNTQFVSNGVVDYDSIVWNFGDPSSGLLNHSVGQSSNHVFSAPMSYSVTMIVFGCEPDTIVRTVTILPCVLPVMLELEVEINDGFPVLNWSSNIVGGANYFVEKSENGISFQAIAVAVANDQSNDDIRFVDGVPNFASEIWYRIRYDDQAGFVTFSNIVSVHLNDQVSRWIEIFPVPVLVEEEISIVTRIPRMDWVEIEVFDSYGAFVLKKSLLAKPPISRFYLPTVDLVSGYYVARATSSMGSESFRLLIR